MTLSSMVVSRDWQEVSVLECILGGLHIDVDVVSEPEHARAKLTKSKIDAVIVDCDLQGASGFLHSLETGSHPQNSAPLVIVSGSRHNRPKLEATGAKFIFEKPISVEQAVHTLSAARNMIMGGRLRYHRQALDVPVWLTVGSRKRLQAHLMNLSQGGVGVRLAQPLEAKGPIRVSFELPGTQYAVKAQGELAWTDECGNAGIRFREIPQRLQRALQLWLAQQYFTH